MPKFPIENPKQLCRYIDREWYHGIHFCDTKDECIKLARFMRHGGIRARAITLRATHGSNYGMQAPERYVIYVLDRDRVFAWGHLEEWGRLKDNTHVHNQRGSSV